MNMACNLYLPKHMKLELAACLHCFCQLVRSYVSKQNRLGLPVVALALEKTRLPCAAVYLACAGHQVDL